MQLFLLCWHCSEATNEYIFPKRCISHSHFPSSACVKKKGKIRKEKFTPPQKQTGKKKKSPAPVALEINLNKNNGVSVGWLPAGIKELLEWTPVCLHFAFHLSVSESVSWCLFSTHWLW